MFEKEFLELMPHTITVEHVLTRNLYGSPASFSTPKSYRCRISGKKLSLRRTQGEEDTVIYDCWVEAKGQNFTVQDRVTLPDDGTFDILQPTIFAVERVSDEDGYHHVKVQFGWMYHRQGQ